MIPWKTFWTVTAQTAVGLLLYVIALWLFKAVLSGGCP